MADITLEAVLDFVGEPTRAAPVRTAGSKAGRPPVKAVAKRADRASSATRPGGTRARPVAAGILSTASIARLAERLGASEALVGQIAGIPSRTLARRRSANATLTANETDRVLRIARIGAQAERVFGDAEKARRWLNRPHPLLGATPLSLLETDLGATAVDHELTRIEYGDFA